MTYQPYLIANMATGVDKSLQPWLIPDDAQEVLLDGYVYRGTMTKRDGYKYFADGERGGSVYRESRINRNLAPVNMVGTLNGVNQAFTLNGLPNVVRGSVTVSSTTPGQVLTDDGMGALIPPSAGVGTVDYITGVINVTFDVAPTGTQPTALYSYMANDPVMMIASFVNSSNTKDLLVASTQFINKYNSTLNILEDITTRVYTGDKYNFFSWTNYDSAVNTPRLIFANNVNPIQQWDGAVVSDYSYQMNTTDAIPVAVNVLTCQLMVEMKGRLLLLSTTENNFRYPKRIRVSGTGAFCDDFRLTATGAGVIDIPDGSWIYGCSFNRDDLLIYTQSSTWVLKYTGNDAVPFVLNKIDETRGSDARFSTFTYLNRTSAASRRGLTMSDGYKVERQDDKIPDFSFNEVNGDEFALCYAGCVDADRDHYLIYPASSQSISTRILVTNYDEDNYCIYRLPLSCMGTYLTSFTVTWNDLLKYKNWKEFGDAYSNWYSFAYNSGAPFSLGGGHNGEIWTLAVTESEDNPVRIFAVTVIDATTVEITTAYNNFGLNEYDQSMGADYISLTGMVGMEELNDQQFPVIEKINDYTFRIDISTATINNLGLTPYVSGGTAVRVIPFMALFKQFNPFVNMDKKVRCGWVYMYVDTTGTDLKRNIVISSITQADPAVVTTALDHNLTDGEQVYFFSIQGMTELNGSMANVTVLSDSTFSLDGVDSTAFGAYTQGGYVSAALPAKMSLDVITNDHSSEEPTQLNIQNADPYQGNMTNMILESGVKKWYKVYINQVGKFIQFKFKNRQAGANINIQAVMPGFSPIGRLI